MKICKDTSFISFLIIFFVFFIYQFFIYKNWIYPFLGSSFSFFELVCIPLVLFSYIKNIKVLKIDIVIFGFLIIIFLNATYYYKFGNLGIYSLHGFEQEINYFSSFLFFFLMGRTFPYLDNYKCKVVGYGYILLIIIVFLGLTNENILLWKGPSNNQNKYAFAIVNYQTLGTVLWVISALIISIRLNNKYYLPVLMIFSIFLVFLSGSRADSLFFLLVICLIFYLIFSLSGILIFSTLIIVILILFSIAFPNNRSINVFNIIQHNFIEKDFPTDHNVAIRESLSHNSLNKIIESPIFGDYKFYAKKDGNFGNYSHNILSIYINYGILGFIFFCYFIYFTVRTSIRLFKYRYIDNRVLFLFILSFVCLLDFILSKSYYNYIFPFTLGLAVQLGNHLKSLQNGAKLETQNSASIKYLGLKLR